MIKPTQLSPADDSGPASSFANDYMAAIGQRVRGARARRGMSRKDLSRDSSISQRYLAQVETGKGNISMALLLRIARALNMDVQEFLPEAMHSLQAEFTQLMSLLRRLSPEQLVEAEKLLQNNFTKTIGGQRGVALIGLRGGGKTTLGQQLATHFDIPFIRLGAVIESLAGSDIADLFSRGGQEKYRTLEKAAVQHVLDTYDRVVLETGGSLVSERATFELVLESFYTVWVQASPSVHMERVLQQGDMRPMKGNSDAMDDLKFILDERSSEYETAHYSLNTSERGVDDCLAELVRQCHSYCSKA